MACAWRVDMIGVLVFAALVVVALVAMLLWMAWTGRRYDAVKWAYRAGEISPETRDRLIVRWFLVMVAGVVVILVAGLAVVVSL